MVITIVSWLPYSIGFLILGSIIGLGSAPSVEAQAQAPNVSNSSTPSVTPDAAAKAAERKKRFEEEQTSLAHARSYPLNTWSNITCRAKGRFQDRDYCASATMDQIVADGKSAIPILISQITDSRWIAEPVYDFWARIRTGELAHFILSDLFLDDTWQKSTMPALFPIEACNEPAWVCWDKFRKTHSLKNIQARWMEFWKVNQGKIYWDEKARCFRLSNAKIDSLKH